MGEARVVDGVVEEFARRLRRRYRLSALILFGSRAEGRATVDSDYDFVAVSPDFAGVPFLKRLPDLYELWHADVGIDVLCYTPAEFEALRCEPTIVKDAAEHGVALV
jgi:predicted nucleotidyltransferase